MEERRGESSDEWMKNSGHTKSAEIVLQADAKRNKGKSGFITKDEARQAASRACDVEGIDPSLSLPDRVARLQDIHQGSPLMQEERQRKTKHLQDTL